MTRWGATRRGGLAFAAFATAGLVGLPAPAAAPPASTQPATTQPAASSALDASVVERHVRDLGHDDFRVRMAAQDALVALGEDVVPRMEALRREAADPEVRTAAGSVLARVAEELAVGATRVTLKVKDAPARDVFDALAAQARGPLRVWPEQLWQHHKAPPITLDLDRQPFWVAVKAFCEQAKLTPRQMGFDDPLSFVQGAPGEMDGAAHVAGPFLVVLSGATEARTVSYGAAGRVNRSLSMQFRFFVEPKLKLLSRAHTPTIDEATDEQGRSLLLPNRGGGGMDAMTSHGPGRVIHTSVGLATLDPPAKRLATIRGRYAVVAQAGVERLEVDDVLNAKGRTAAVAGRNVVINDVQADGEQVTLKVVITRDPAAAAAAVEPGPRPPPGWGDLNAADLQLLDADGRPLPRRGSSGSGSNDRYELELRFRRDDATGVPARLVWEMAVGGREIEVPFEFTDLPLPE